MFIDEWFSAAFYRKLPLGYHNEANFRFGQIFWTHAYYPHENLEFWRPIPDRSEPTKTIASQFRITAAGQDAFKRALPLQAPKLKQTRSLSLLGLRSDPSCSSKPNCLSPQWIIGAFGGAFNVAGHSSLRSLA